MSEYSAIEWTHATWNPVRGCTKISPGCKHCYAETFAERFRGVPNHPFEQGFDLRLVPSALELPLRWRKGRLVFVNSMSDLFHEDVPDEYIEQVFGVMETAKQHQFQVLTKRAERMAAFVERCGVPENVWMGVSVESAAYRSRIVVLRRVPARVRFLSLEPLIGAPGRTRSSRDSLGHRGWRERPWSPRDEAGMGRAMSAGSALLPACLSSSSSGAASRRVGGDASSTARRGTVCPSRRAWCESTVAETALPFSTATPRIARRSRRPQERRAARTRREAGVRRASGCASGASRTGR